MTSRDGTVHPLHPWPEAFPESWKVSASLRSPVIVGPKKLSLPKVAFSSFQTNDQTDRKCLAPCLYCKETTVSEFYFLCNEKYKVSVKVLEKFDLLPQISAWISLQTNPCRASAREMDALKARCSALLHFVLGRNLNLLHHVGRSACLKMFK